MHWQYEHVTKHLLYFFEILSAAAFRPTLCRAFTREHQEGQSCGVDIQLWTILFFLSRVGFAQLISTSIARVHNFSTLESNYDFKKKSQSNLTCVSKGQLDQDSNLVW